MGKYRQRKYIQKLVPGHNWNGKESQELSNEDNDIMELARGQTQACGNKLETRNLKANMVRWNGMKKAMVGKVPWATKL